MIDFWLKDFWESVNGERKEILSGNHEKNFQIQEKRIKKAC